MPHRNSTIRNQPESIVTLRRSPRLLRKELPPPEYPKTPDPQLEKTHKRYPELKSGSNISVCLRRSPRFSGNKGTTTDEFDEKISSGEANRKGLLNVGKDEVGINESTVSVVRSEKRVTRCSGRGINESKQIASVKKITEEELPVVGNAKLGFHPCKGIGAKIEKRVTRPSSRGINESKEIESVEKITEEELPVVGSAKLGFHQCKGIGAKIEKRVTRHSSRGINGSKEIESVEKITEEGLPVVENAK